MTTLNDDFSGSDGTLVSGRPGWIAFGWSDWLYLDGSGATKDNGAEDAKWVMTDTGSPAHYVEFVLGAGFMGSVDVGVCLANNGSTRYQGIALGWRTEGGLEVISHRSSIGGNTSVIDSIAGTFVAGDAIFFSWDPVVGNIQVKQNGTLIYNWTKNTENEYLVQGIVGQFAGMVAGYNSRTPTTDVFRSWSSGELGGAPTDTEDPTLTGSITIGAKTSSSIAISWPAGSDNVGVTSYEVSSNGGASWTDVGNVLAHTFTGLAPLTSYDLSVRAKDAAGNASTPPLALSVTTDAAPPPVLSAPTATATGSTTATGAVSTNEANGTLYFYASTNATEDVATVKASGASQAVTVTGVQGVSVIGLNGSTTYYLHFVHTDPADNDSACVSSASFTTSAAPGTAKLTLPTLRNNTGTLLANEVDATVHIYEVASGNKVATVTGATSDSAGMLVVHSSSMTSGTQYRAVVVLASGAEGLQKVTATV